MSVAQLILAAIGLPKEDRLASRRLSVLDAASAISWGVLRGDDEIVERGRTTLAWLEVPSA
ncbi:hypothetical protein [Streptomyces chartreusis]|uniref:hypothetical protein n=1 Tax=Streptomyces chartreusis TaxID=1969 RepID=UPI0036327A1B